MIKVSCIWIIIIVFSYYKTYSQDTLLLNRIVPKDAHLIGKFSNKYEEQVSHYTEKSLKKMSRQERVLKCKLSRIDREAAARLFPDNVQKFGNQYREKLLSEVPGSGYLDTTQLTLRFLTENKNIHSDEIAVAIKQVQSLQGKLQMTESVKTYMSERIVQLAELSKYNELSKDLIKIKKEVYYYREQLTEYKSLFEDKRKALKKTLELLKKMPAYNDFLSRNSQIASLFNLGSDYNNLRSLDGLQVRLQVEQVIAQRVGDAPGGAAMVSSLLNEGSEKFKEVRAKFPTLENSSQAPEFKPNEMKTKRVIDRFEPGGNIQFQKSNYYFPSMADLAGQLAYRFHKNGTVGMGFSYRLGMGVGWQKIRISHQGAGLRSFLEWKLKRTFYLNGGYELTRTANILNYETVKNWNGWIASALLGINRKQKINQKLYLNTMILYDFLASQQPRTDKVKIRIGYTIK